MLRPDLLILDLNLPVVNGWEILRYIKRSPLLRFLPVVILSSSKADHDIARAYRGGASSYIHKGRDLDGIQRAVDAIYELRVLVRDRRSPGGYRPRALRLG